MTQEEANEITKNKCDCWDLAPGNGRKKFLYEHRIRNSKGPFSLNTIYCDTREFFYEFIEAYNTLKDWGDYRIPNDQLKEESGQLLMF